MTRKLVFTLTLMVLMAALFVSVPAARADSLTLTFSPAFISTTPGGTYSVTANLFAPTSNTGAIWLNGVSATPNAPFITADASDFFVSTPFFLNAGESASFNIDVAIGNVSYGSYGKYPVFVNIQGGATAADQAVIASAPFQVQVPEPASMMLLGAGMMGLAGMIRRKR